MSSLICSFCILFRVGHKFHAARGWQHRLGASTYVALEDRHSSAGENIKMSYGRQGTFALVPTHVSLVARLSPIRWKLCLRQQ